MIITYWKPIAIVLLVVSIFIAGWHYEALRISAKELKQTQISITEANKKIDSNNKIDAAYSRAVTVIENSKPEISDEKDSNHPLPTKWLHALRIATTY